MEDGSHESLDGSIAKVNGADLPATTVCSSSYMSKSWRPLLWRSCRTHDIEGHLPAMWPLLLNRPHMGNCKGFFHESMIVL
jgi:hypothetical protein